LRDLNPHAEASYIFISERDSRVSKGLGSTGLERGWILILAGALLVAALWTMFSYGGYGALEGFALGTVLAASAIGLIIVVGFVGLGVQRTVTDKRIRYLALAVAVGVFFFSSQIRDQFNFQVYPMSMAESAQGVDSPLIWVLVLGGLLAYIGFKASKIQWR